MADSVYKNDPRIPCKYGAKCYQKNSAHHEKYKHPNKRPNNKTTKVTNKRQKTEEINSKIEHTPRSEISDSEDENQSEEQPVSDELLPNDDTEQLKEPESENLEENSKRTPKTFDKPEFIKTNFLVQMPPDFYQFWEYCKDLNKEHPSNALKDVGLELVGPFDVLADKFSDIKEPSSQQYLLHWRYYYDIPEFQTVLKGDGSLGFHIGYFRDDPNDQPVFMAQNSAEKDGEITYIGDNIFAAVFLYLEDKKKKVDPFKRMNLMKIQSSVKSKAEELNCSLSLKTNKIQERNRKIVTRCLNKAGLVVPYDRKTQQGYRELSVSSKEFNSLLQRYKTASQEKKPKIKTELEEVFRWASIALDECDFGTGIELGWDIIYSGVEDFDSVAARFLGSSYRLLQRDAFAEIAEAHMKNRRKGDKISII